jgi:hypothetical protein
VGPVGQARALERVADHFDLVITILNKKHVERLATLPGTS